MSSIVYIPHGGGPYPVLGGMGHEKLIKFLKELPSFTGYPKEILVISAHWEEDIPAVTCSQNNSLLYDYYGFPDIAYKIEYPTKGNSELAKEIESLLIKNQIKVLLEPKRGIDHGVFIPLKLIYPKGEIPVTQLSLKRGLSPREHIDIGKALRPLLNRDIMILGSGFSYHNLGEFQISNNCSSDKLNDIFQDWLIETCTDLDTESAIEDRLINWVEAPGARYCHPREEHLLPLHLCYGLGRGRGEVIFDDTILGKRAISIYWKR